MTRPPIVDRKRLPKLVKEGKSQIEIANIFGVSQVAVSVALRKMKLATIKNVVLEAAPKVVEKNLNAVDQLQRINDVANNLLNELTGEDHIIDNMVKAVQATIEFKANPSKDNETYLKNIIKMVNSEKNTAIKACAEIRGQLSLQLEIFQTLYDIEAVAEFQREVLDAIAEVAPAVQKTIINNLKKRKALRESVSFRKLRSDL